MDYNDVTLQTFYSKTMSRFFNDLDQKVFDMEKTIKFQNEKIHELNNELCVESSRKMIESNAMIGNILKACICGGNIQQMGPGAAIVLDRIRTMQTIEEVHSYVNRLIGETRDKMLNQ